MSYRLEDGKLFQYILTVFEAFANEAGVLGGVETWTAHRVDREVRQFLGTITLGARAKYDGRLQLDLPEITSHVDGSIKPMLWKVFEDSPEWQRYQSDLLEVAKLQSNIRPLATPGTLSAVIVRAFPDAYEPAPVQPLIPGN